MAKIKICGLKRWDDINYVNQSLPDYVGFVFAPSKRQVTVEQAKGLTGALCSGIITVGVFVDAPIAAIEQAVRECELQAVQLHGFEDAGYITDLRKILPAETQIIKAIRVKDEQSIQDALELNSDTYLFDTYCENMAGGSGKAFNWQLLSSLQTDKPYFLAGGLHAENIQDAIQSVHPYAVDISSGVETDGVKDAQKIQNIIQTIRNIQ